MNRKSAGILFLIILSGANSVYVLYTILTFHNMVGASVSRTSQFAEIVSRQPYFLIPVTIGIVGWLSTIFLVLTIHQERFNKTLRKIVSDKGFDRTVYKILMGKGGARRLAIMAALDTPKLRNEIANITNTDWKEVDRNVKILESVNLVGVKFSHGSILVYNLTEIGRELMEIIQAHHDSSASNASTQQS